jgi:hypothetical protein
MGCAFSAHFLIFLVQLSAINLNQVKFWPGLAFGVARECTTDCPDATDLNFCRKGTEGTQPRKPSGQGRGKPQPKERDCPDWQKDGGKKILVGIHLYSLLLTCTDCNWHGLNCR